MARRVVITGLGVLAPTGHGIGEFTTALRSGASGIRYVPELASLGFSCQVGGALPTLEDVASRYFGPATLVGMDRHSVIGCIAGLDAWDDAGLARMSAGPTGTADWDASIAFGTGIGGIATIGKVLAPFTDAARVRRLGSAIPERIMGSATGARLAGLLGIGGQVASNSSACATGTEAILNGYRMIHAGCAKRVLAGACEGDSAYTWAGFDAMRVLSRGYNHDPEKASRPMSATAAGFVPAAGAGAVVLEDLDAASARGARIYAEVLGGHVNCGGQRNGGTMTAGNPEGARKCIEAAIATSGIDPHEIDLISGHLTATMADAAEVGNWEAALRLSRASFPLLNAPKSLLGHTLGAAGAIESVACVVQLANGFVHPSLNCEDLHPELAWCEPHIPRQRIDRDLRIIAKASFGFGDVNACAIFRKWN